MSSRRRAAQNAGNLHLLASPLLRVLGGDAAAAAVCRWVVAPTMCAGRRVAPLLARSHTRVFCTCAAAASFWGDAVLARVLPARRMRINPHTRVRDVPLTAPCFISRRRVFGAFSTAAAATTSSAVQRCGERLPPLCFSSLLAPCSVAPHSSLLFVCDLLLETQAAASTHAQTQRAKSILQSGGRNSAQTVLHTHSATRASVSSIGGLLQKASKPAAP